MAEFESVTLEECEEVLRKDLKTNDFEILEYHVKPLSEALGIMGGHNTLEIKVKTNEQIIQKKYFVKRMQSIYEIQNRMIKEQGAYDKEKFMYDFLEELSKVEPRYKNDFVPKCYLTAKDDKFILEHLTEQGFTTSKSERYSLNSSEIKTTLSALAKFHASSIIYEHKKSQQLGRKYKISDEFSQYLEDSIYRDDKNYLGNKIHTSGLEAVLAQIDICELFTPEERLEIKKKVSQLGEKVGDLVKESDKFCNVIIHGDLWCNNILFKYKNNKVEDCKLIDFQAIRYSVPAFDFLYVLQFSSSKKILKEHQEEFQDDYYYSLKQCLEECDIDINDYMTFEEFLQSIEYILPLNILRKAQVATFYILDFNTDILEDPEKFRIFLYENKADRCVETYKKQQTYREKIHEEFQNFTLL